MRTSENTERWAEAPRLKSLLEAGREEGRFRTAIAVAGGVDGPLYVESAGTPTPDERRETTVDTRFDLASLTKPIVTTTICLRFVEHGRLTLTDTLGDHIPEIEETELAAVPIRTLLTHTSGLQDYAFSMAWDGRNDVLSALIDDDLLDREIGSSFEYSCLNYVFLSEVLRQESGSTLTSLAEEHVFEPARMGGASLGPNEPAPGVPVVATYDREYRERELRNEIHDPISNAMAGESGNAGLFASARDVMRYARALLKDASGADRLLSAATVDLLPVRRSGTDTKAQGYGWLVGTDVLPAPQWSPQTVGHTGFTGTSLWIDLERKRFACLLSNAVYEQGDLYRFRQRFHAMVGSDRLESATNG